MYRLSDDLGKLILSKIRPAEIESSGPNAFVPKNLNSIGIIDLTVAVGTSFHYSIECPVNVIYQDFPSIPATVLGYFLYKKEEILQPVEPWPILEMLVNPLTKDCETEIDVADCTIQLASSTEKLTAKTISTLDRLIELEPTILDCLMLDK